MTRDVHFSRRSDAHSRSVTRSLTRLMALSALLGLLGGCAGTGRAPVEDRSSGAVRPAAPAAPGSVAATPTSPAEPARVPPGAENAGKPGYFTVRPGDTLIRVGLETGQNWRDIARWNGIDNPNVIEVGQVLRVVPPVADANGVVVRPVAPAGRVEGRPLDGKPAAPGAPAATTPAPVATPPGASAPPAAAASPAPAPAPAPAPGAAARDPEEDVGWAWPAAGAVVTPFDEQRSKGLAISGKAGDPVLAAADGRVVYAGSGLRGYGNLVIVKHNNTYLTAYAHNQALLVKEDQLVRRGQKIAEMGSSDAERVQLHFEIRRQGKPVDPARLLPAR
jgi:lipoprotein NlpD